MGVGKSPCPVEKIKQKNQPEKNQDPYMAGGEKTPSDLTKGSEGKKWRNGFDLKP